MNLKKTLIMVLSCAALLSGCGKNYPIPMSLYEEFQEIICNKDKNSINENAEAIKVMGDITARFNVFIIDHDFKSNPEFARTHALRLSWVMDRKNCGQPFPNKAEYQDGSPSLFSKFTNPFSNKPKCDSEEARKAVLNDYAEVVAGNLFKSLTVDEIKSNMTLVNVTTVNDQSEAVSCKANIELKLDNGFEVTLLDNGDTVYKGLTNAFMNNSGMGSLIVPSTANAAIAKFSVQKTFNTGLNDLTPEKIRESFVKEMGLWSIPINFTIKKQDSIQINMKVLDEDAAFTSACLLSYTKNGAELLKALKKNDASATPTQALDAASAPPAPTPTPTAIETTPSTSTAPVASFDCNKASSTQEKLICTNPALGEADLKLSIAYKTALQKSTNPEQLKKDQINWMKTNRNLCTDSQCLMTSISSRTSALAN
jgi:uncharacterized protein YecT (DUF1311 family)